VWTGGSNQTNVAGVYGSMGTPAAANLPGARDGAASWLDPMGAAWVFGGYGYDAAGTTIGYLNDLWKYAAGKWTWVGGPTSAGQGGMYGSLGTPSTQNLPGARAGTASCGDGLGNTFLFGGVNASGEWNDLWRYDQSGAWTWLSGSASPNAAGSYGTLGVANGNNTPGARQGAVCWLDGTGKLWLFGGNTGTAFLVLNDLWSYSLSASQWTWMAGSNTTGQAGLYTGATPHPGARFYSALWNASAGTVFLFGGGGFDSTGTPGSLNDFWKLSGTQFSFLSGSNAANPAGAYGPDAGPNFPAGRGGAAFWTDTAGKLWLFGGNASATSSLYMSDFWSVDHFGVWTWVGGPSTAQQAATYGAKGTPAPTNTPGGRAGAASWSDASGKLWMFGGVDGTAMMHNDLWSY
jgi:hypothetical protein